MTIGLIRHFPVQHPFLKGWVRQSEVLQWFEEYNKAALQEMEVKDNVAWELCYPSEMPRASKTAKTLFKRKVKHTALLNEPFPDPVFNRDIKLPFFLWTLIIRGAILFNHPSQSERKKILKTRIRRLLPDMRKKTAVFQLSAMPLQWKLSANFGTGRICRQKTKKA